MMRDRGRKQVGGKVRPTTQKILESLSGILAPRLEGATVLDLFAGTGSVGFRLAEEGVETMIFVESHRKVAQELRGRLRSMESETRFSLVVGVVPKVLANIRGEFDLVVCDPPYDWTRANSLLPSCLKLLKIGGLLVVEHHHKTVYEACTGWELYRREKFGETRLSFFERTLEELLVHEPD